MPDFLVKLYELPNAAFSSKDKLGGNVKLRRGMAYEKQQVVEWVRAKFGIRWASECDVAFSNHPISCHIATDNGAILGFACYDSTSLGVFGPIGILESARGKGIGSELLLASLRSMAALGYAYAIIGAASSVEFYQSALGQANVLEIPGSTPGIYADRLRE